MKSVLRLAVALAIPAGACFAQQWEVGVIGGGSFVSSIPVTAAAGSATTGLHAGGAFGVFFAQNPFRHLSGELRYNYLFGSRFIQSGAAEARSSGVQHVVHYDLILHTAANGRWPQYFVAFGGGIKVFQSAGSEAAAQPLAQFASLTETRQNEPMASLGAGVRIPIGDRTMVRAEFRDYIAPFPTNNINPAVNATFQGDWLHNIVPMVGLSFVF